MVHPLSEILVVHLLSGFPLAHLLSKILSSFGDFIDPSSFGGSIGPSPPDPTAPASTSSGCEARP